MKNTKGNRQNTQKDVERIEMKKRHRQKERNWNRVKETKTRELIKSWVTFLPSFFQPVDVVILTLRPFGHLFWSWWRCWCSYFYFAAVWPFVLMMMLTLLFWFWCWCWCWCCCWCWCWCWCCYFDFAAVCVDVGVDVDDENFQICETLFRPLRNEDNGWYFNTLNVHLHLFKKVWYFCVTDY